MYLDVFGEADKNILSPAATGWANPNVMALRGNTRRRQFARQGQQHACANFFFPAVRIHQAIDCHQANMAEV